MSKVEEAAYKAYPKMSRISEPHGVIPADNESHYLGDANEEKREGFIEGYHQAEKDLELTSEDIYVILYYEREVMREFGKEEHTNEEICMEVLKRFKERKKIEKNNVWDEEDVIYA